MLAFIYKDGMAKKGGVDMVSSYQDSLTFVYSPDAVGGRFYIKVRCYDNSEFEISLNPEDIRKLKKELNKTTKYTV